MVILYEIHGMIKYLLVFAIIYVVMRLMNPQRQLKKQEPLDDLPEEEFVEYEEIIDDEGQV